MKPNPKKYRKPPPHHSDDISEINRRLQLENAAEVIFNYGKKIACPLHGRDQTLTKPIMACDHCERQDLDKPNGIVLMPMKYFLCRMCQALLNRHQLDLGNGLKVRCRRCIKTEVLRIMQIEPLLYDSHNHL